MDLDDEVRRLRRKLESEDARERGEAAVEAGRLGDSRLVPDLIRAAAYDVEEYQISFGMVDEDTSVAHDAANVLARLLAKHPLDEAEMPGLRTAILDANADEESVCFLLRSLGDLIRPSVPRPLSCWAPTRRRVPVGVRLGPP